MARHFADLHDGSHGKGGDTVSRPGKERHFRRPVELLPLRRAGLGHELDVALFLVALFSGEGEAGATGVRRIRDGGLGASWTLSWPEQRETEIATVTSPTYYGGGFHHPVCGARPPTTGP